MMNQQQQAGRTISKDDIGYPVNFQHVFHVGPGDNVGADADHRALFQVVPNRVENAAEGEEVELRRDDKENDDEEKPVEIGYPTDFRHIIHISCGPSRGAFNVETDDEKLSEFLRKSGVSETHLRDDDVSEFIMDYIDKQLRRTEDDRSSKYEFLKNFKEYLMETKLLETTRNERERTDEVKSIETGPPSTSETNKQEESGGGGGDGQQRNDTDEEDETNSCTGNAAKPVITKEDIGVPTDFQHITHITCSESDEFIIETNDETLSEFFKKAGVSETDLHDKDTLEFILDYIEKHLERQKEASSKNDFLKNLKEYLVQFKAKNAPKVRMRPRERAHRRQGGIKEAAEDDNDSRERASQSAPDENAERKQAGTKEDSG